MIPASRQAKNSFTPSLNSINLVIWVCVLLISNMMTGGMSWYIELAGLIPFGFMLYHLFLAWRRYRFEEEAFTSSNLFGTTVLPYEQINAVQYRGNGLLKQYLLGYPPRSILIRCKDVNMEVLNGDEAVMKRLRESNP